MNRILTLAVALVMMAGSLAAAADISGSWTAKFETQIGEQNYTYDFKVTGATLTGTATSANGKSELANGKVEGDTVIFTENLTFDGMTIPVTYTGKIVGDDEIQFTRVVGEFATETLVAKRVK
jgi:hypothetical protein